MGRRRAPACATLQRVRRAVLGRRRRVQPMRDRRSGPPPLVDPPAVGGAWEIAQLLLLLLLPPPEPRERRWPAARACTCARGAWCVWSSVPVHVAACLLACLLACWQVARCKMQPRQRSALGREGRGAAGGKKQITGITLLFLVRGFLRAPLASSCVGTSTSAHANADAATPGSAPPPRPRRCAHLATRMLAGDVARARASAGSGCGLAAAYKTWTLALAPRSHRRARCGGDRRLPCDGAGCASARAHQGNATALRSVFGAVAWHEGRRSS
eukprot:scaffold601_cov496-Prasinococcus_capsulatus_cf.AAC.1